MLAADKLLLESRIARGAVQLKWKEFGLHHLNLTTVGTQAAVMAGFSITALIEFAPSPDANNSLKQLTRRRRRDVAELRTTR